MRRHGDPAETEILVWAVDSPATPISLGPGTAYAFLPGTTSVAIAGGDEEGSLRVVDIETGDVARTIETDAKDVAGMSADPTDLLALMQRGSAEVVVLDVDRGEQVATFAVVGGQSAEFSPDGRWLAIGSFDNLVHLFDTEDFADTPLPGSPNLVAKWRSRRTAPAWRRSAPVNFDSGRWRPRPTPRWATSTRPAPCSSS